MTDLINTIKMTPSEFIVGVLKHEILAESLSQSGSAANNVMLDLFNVSACRPSEITASIDICGVGVTTMEIGPTAAVWSEILNVGIAVVRNGRGHAEAVNLLLDNNFEKFMLDDSTISLGIKHLFDHAFYLILNTIPDRRVPSLH